jgi:tetratricopeptide (TPR) repeat protein
MVAWWSRSPAGTQANLSRGKNKRRAQRSSGRAVAAPSPSAAAGRPAATPATSAAARARTRALSRAPAAARRHGLLLAALAIALAGAAYGNALHNPFVYDDRGTVVENPSLADLTNLHWILIYSPFRPLVNLSYALDRHWWGLDPFGYHLTNTALHMLNVALFFGLAAALARDRRAWGARQDTAPPSPWLAAFAAAALFAVHPMMTEAVGYASGRPEVLCGTFVLLSLWCAHRGMREDSPRWLYASLAPLVLGLASREVAAMVPFFLLAADRLLQLGSEAGRRRRLWTFHLPLMLLVLVGGAYRLHSFLAAESRGLPRPVGAHALTELVVFWHYLGLVLWPTAQSIVHPAQRITTPWHPALLTAVAALVGAAAGAWALRRRFPLGTLALLWFPLFLLPSSSLIPLLELMAEHRVYVASCGLFLLGGLGFAWLFAAAAGRPGVRALGYAALTAVLAVLFAATVLRNRVWADPVTLWRDATEKAPLTWAPFYALGDALREKGDCAAAIPVFRRAVDLLPQEPRARMNLGICLADVRRYAEARQVFEEALRADPTSVQAQDNLGRLALLAGRPEEARQRFQQVLRSAPRDVVARLNLALLFETRDGNPAAALRLCGEVLAEYPRSSVAAACVQRNQARLGAAAPAGAAPGAAPGAPP